MRRKKKKLTPAQKAIIVAKIQKRLIRNPHHVRCIDCDEVLPFRVGSALGIINTEHVAKNTHPDLLYDLARSYINVVSESTDKSKRSWTCLVCRYQRKQLYWVVMDNSRPVGPSCYHCTMTAMNEIEGDVGLRSDVLVYEATSSRTSLSRMSLIVKNRPKRRTKAPSLTDGELF